MSGPSWPEFTARNNYLSRQSNSQLTLTVLLHCNLIRSLFFLKSRQDREGKKKEPKKKNKIPSDHNSSSASPHLKRDFFIFYFLESVLRSVCWDSSASGHPALLLLARCGVAWSPSRTVRLRQAETKAIPRRRLSGAMGPAGEKFARRRVSAHPPEPAFATMRVSPECGDVRFPVQHTGAHTPGVSLNPPLLPPPQPPQVSRWPAPSRPAEVLPASLSQPIAALGLRLGTTLRVTGAEDLRASTRWLRADV